MFAKENREQIVRDAKSGLILDAARKVFAEKSFHDARLEDIAAEAGFSKAALYNYYSDKETIFLSLANRDFDRLLEAMKCCLDPEKGFADNLRGALRAVLSFFGGHFAFVLASADFRQKEIGGVMKLTECQDGLFVQFKKKFSGILDVLLQVIKAGIERGEMRTSLDERVISNYIVSLTRGVLFEWKMQGKQGDIDTEIEQIIAFLRRGLDLKS